MFSIKNRFIAFCTMFMIAFSNTPVGLAKDIKSDTDITGLVSDDNDVIAYAKLGSNIEEKGMKVTVGDVNSPRIGLKDGVEGWALDPKDGTQSRYLCLDIDDNLVGYDDNSLYELTVEYYDEGHSSLVAAYSKRDIQNPAYKKRHWAEIYETIKVVETDILDFTDTKTWKQKTWIIDSPAMKNSLNGYDLRVGIYGEKMGYSTDGKVVVSSVKVKRLNKQKFVDIKVSSKNYGNIFFTGDLMDFDIAFNNNVNPVMGEKYGTYNADVKYTLIDSDGVAVETKNDTVQIQPNTTTNTNVTFQVDKYDVYVLKVEINNEKLKLYSYKEAKCSYVRSTRGEIINPRCGVSSATGNNRDANELAKLINYAGIQYARINISSRFIIRSSYDNNTPTGTPALGGLYKSYIKNFLDNNVKVTAYHGNDLVTIAYSEDGTKMPNTELGMQRWTDAESAAIDWFGDGIYAWEIFNETNLLLPYKDDYYAPETARVVKYEYPIQKERHPNVLIGGPQVSVVGNSNAFYNGYFPENFIKNGGADDIDFFSHHCYLWGADPITNSPVNHPADGSVKDYKELMRKYGVKDKEVWCTEYGYAAYTKNCQDEIQQAAWNIQQTMMMCEDNATDKYFIFRLDNSTSEIRSNQELNFGLIGVSSYTATDEITDKAHAKPGYLAFSNFNILMHDAEYHSRIDLNKNTLGYRYKKTESGTDLFTMFTNKKSDKISVDLGTDNVTLTDMYGNEQKLTSVDGTYTFTITQEPFYVEGKFGKFEVVDKSSVAPDSDSVGGFYNGEIAINLHNETGKTLKFEATHIDSNYNRNVSTGDLSGKTESVKINIGDTATKGYEPVKIKIYDDSNVYYCDNVYINYDKPVDISIDAQLKQDFNWYMTVKLTNRSSENEITGTFKFIRPAEWAQAVPEQQITLKPSEVKEFEIMLPKSIEEQNGREATYAFITDEQSGNGVYGSKTFDFVYAPKAKNIVIDGNLDEWTEGWMMLNSPEQFMAPIGYLNEYMGVTDIWGKVAVKWDEEKLYFAAYVDDDVFYCQDVNESRLWSTDGIQIGVVYDPNGKYIGSQYEEYAIGLLEGKPTIYRHVTNMPYETLEERSRVDGVELMIKNSGRITTYEMSIPWSSIIPKDDNVEVKAGSVLKFGCIINENDGNGRKGYYKLADDGVGSNKNSNHFAKLLLCE